MLVRFAPSLIALVSLAGMLSAANEQSAPSPTSWRCLAPRSSHASLTAADCPPRTELLT
jgi:hypothetical protein